MKDTIFALSTAPGVSALAVLRISGPDAFSTLEKIITGEFPSPRVATLKKITWRDQIIDEGIVICFNSESSFTGEKVVELQIHGSQAVIKKLSSVFQDRDFVNLRPAEEGEFTRRAFYNGKLDLTQVEGLSDLLSAETETQRKWSIDSYSGGLSRDIDKWRGILTDILSDFEANIDFSDEDIEPINLSKKIDELIVLMSEKEHIYNRVKVVKDGIEIAIIGPPNVGKSTLLNRLGNRKLSLTSEIAGTTRDIIEVRVEIKGIPVTFLDTAGLRETNDKLERDGIALVKERIEGVFSRVFLINEEKDIETLGVQIKDRDFVFKSKSDEGNSTKYRGLSGKTGKGLRDLINDIEKMLPSINRVSGIIVDERQMKKVKQTIEVLKVLKKGLEKDKEIEILAEECRRGVRFLDELEGKIDSELVLGNIFKKFCIGK